VTLNPRHPTAPHRYADESRELPRQRKRELCAKCGCELDRNRRGKLCADCYAEEMDDACLTEDYLNEDGK
jgi:predicted amidophosphoribosyltransferase